MLEGTLSLPEKRIGGAYLEMAKTARLRAAAYLTVEHDQTVIALAGRNEIARFAV